MRGRRCFTSVQNAGELERPRCPPPPGSQCAFSLSLRVAMEIGSAKPEPLASASGTSTRRTTEIAGGFVGTQTAPRRRFLPGGRADFLRDGIVRERGMAERSGTSGVGCTRSPGIQRPLCSTDRWVAFYFPLGLLLVCLESMAMPTFARPPADGLGAFDRVGLLPSDSLGGVAT